MPNIRRPKRGSKAYWPRARAKRSYARVRNWQQSLEPNRLGGFIGYKAGMTHALFRDNSPNSLNKNADLSLPLTIIECPPLKPLSLCFYKNTDAGLVKFAEVYSEHIPKEVKNHYTVKKAKTQVPTTFDDLRLKVSTQPQLLGFGKKKPDVLEFSVGGTDKLAYAQSLLHKDIRISDVFNEGTYLDVKGVSIGKGFQGTVKRYGVRIRQHKAEKVKRGTGNLGSWTPKKILFSVPQAGQMGFQTRIEYNKTLLKISNNPEEVNPKSGFNGYGLVKNDYLLIHTIY